MRTLFVVTFFLTYLCTKAQQYYVGVPINDTILTVGFGDYNYGCYPDYTQNFYVQNQFFPYVTGLNVGFKITHNLPVGDLTTQYGVANSGDTLAISASQLGYEFYFASQGTVSINLIVYGTPSVLSESYICGPWVACASQATCLNWGIFSSNFCFGSPNYCSVQPTTSINETKQSNNFDIYPNPSAGFFTINQLSDNTIFEKLEIFNVVGEKIYQTELNGLHSTNIDISNNSTGFYYIRFINNNNLIAVDKIIIAK